MQALDDFEDLIIVGGFVQTVCERCGNDWQYHNRYRWRETFDTSVCYDCKATPQKTMRTAYGTCIIWQGDMDLDTMQLLQDGVPVFVYERVCGLADCVNGAHRA